MDVDSQWTYNTDICVMTVKICPTGATRIMGLDRNTAMGCYAYQSILSALNNKTCLSAFRVRSVVSGYTIPITWQYGGCLHLVVYLGLLIVFSVYFEKLKGKRKQFVFDAFPKFSGGLLPGRRWEYRIS